MKNALKKTRKFVLLSVIVCALLMYAMMSVSAAEYTDGYYTYTVAYGEATITDVDTAISGDVTVPDTLGGYDVVKIGEYAFEWCDKMTSVTLPECLVEIGDYAFVDCRSMKNFTVVGSGFVDTCKLETIGDNAFLRCMVLEAVDIPDSVTYLGEYAFAACYEIADVKLGEGINILRFCTFDWCQKITSIDIGNNIQRIESCAFNKCTSLKYAYIGENASYIDVGAFNSCIGLECIDVSIKNDYYISKDGALYTTLQNSSYFDRKPHTLIRLTKDAIFDNTYTIPVDLYWIDPASLTEVGRIDFNTSHNRGYFYKANNALMHCVDYDPNPSNITMVKYLGNDKFYTVPTNVNNVSYLCFSGADFEKVIVPEGITSLPSSCFFDCKNLKEVILPSTLTKIGSGCFHGCISLEKINVPDGVTEIEGFLFCDCTSLKDFKIPKNVTMIAEYAFTNTAIEEMVIPETVTEIKSYAFSHLTKKITIKGDLEEISDFTFYSCGALETIEFKGSVEKIGKSAFEGCLSLKNIILPSTIKEINKAAFMYCWSLESIVLPENITKIANNTFKYCSALTEIAIPATVTEIEDDAFMYVDNLKYVYFDGTQAQWNDILIGKNNDALNKATIIFADGISCKHNSVTNYGQVEATCKNTGFTAGVYCDDCEIWLEGHTEIAKADHKDGNADGKCDTCGLELAKACTCKCHGNFIQRLIFKITNFFAKLFNPSKRICACGVKH